MPHERPGTEWLRHISGTPGHYRGHITIRGVRIDRRGKTKTIVRDKLFAAAEKLLSGEVKPKTTPRKVTAGSVTVDAYLTGWMSGQAARVVDGSLAPRALEADQRNVTLHLAPALARLSQAMGIPERYHVSMTDVATIKVPRVVRDRVRDAARAAHLTQAQLIEEMLEERRKAEFWAALEAETPDREYLNELAETDAAFAGDAEESIARFEAGQ
nr:hypothetical protein [Propionicimonas sp.]